MEELRKYAAGVLRQELAEHPRSSDRSEFSNGFAAGVLAAAMHVDAITLSENEAARCKLAGLSVAPHLDYWWRA